MSLSDSATGPGSLLFGCLMSKSRDCTGSKGGDTAALLTLIDDLRSRVATKLGGGPINVACCFEAGRDGFWLYRVLTAHGIAAYML